MHIYKLFLLICLMACAEVVIAQSESLPITVKPDDGEHNAMFIYQLGYEASKGNRPVILVARLGDGEKSSSLNLRRLHNARVQLVSYPGVTNVKVKQGKRIEGNGRVEFYLDGKLYLVSLTRRGEDLRVDCCEPRDNLYPWYDRTKKTRHKGRHKK